MSEEKRPSHESPGYETTDATFKPLFISGLALFAVVLVALFVAYGVLNLFDKPAREARYRPAPLATERRLPPEPRLQVKPEVEWETFEARQDSIINSAGWVSKEAGVVRIPIERALEMMLQRGYPARQPNPKSNGGR